MTQEFQARSTRSDELFAGGYRRRFFTFRTFIQSLAAVFRDPGRVMHALFRSRLDSAFAERIMIAVTSVNKCRYCSHLHAKIALENGSSPREIQMLLDGDISNCREGEAVALAFAQHYADSEEHPAKTSVQKLYTCYGRERARAILTYVQMITIGNLMGNTLDAFRSRLRGERPARPLSVFEFLSFLIGAPFGQLIMRK